MAQRAPHRKMFLFIYVYIYIFLYYFTYGRAILFFFNRPGTVLDCRAHFWCFSKVLLMEKKPVVGMWIDNVYWCVLMISTDVYWYVYWWIKWLWVGLDKRSNAHWIGALVPMCPQYTSVHIGTHQYTLAHISTHQYTSVQISTHWYTSVHIGTHQYTSD